MEVFQGMADLFESRIFMESKIKDICNFFFFFKFPLSGIFTLIRFLIPITKGNPPLLKIIKHPDIFIQNPDNNSTFLLLIFFPLVSSYLIYCSLLSLPALISGMVPGIKHLTETFCCSLHGYDKWQIVTAGAVLSKINQECAKNSGSFCRIPMWNRHCVDWRKRQLINSSQIKTLRGMRSTEMSSWSQQVCHQVCSFLLAFARKIPKKREPLKADCSED